MTEEERLLKEANLKALNDAIAQGAVEVWYGDKRVRYRSLNEMLRIRDILRDELGLNLRSPRVRYGSFNKGIK